MKQQLKPPKYRLHQKRFPMRMIKEKITPGLYYYKSLKNGQKKFKACQYPDSHHLLLFTCHQLSQVFEINGGGGD